MRVFCVPARSPHNHSLSEARPRRVVNPRWTKVTRCLFLTWSPIYHTIVPDGAGGFGPRPFAQMSQEDRLRAVYQHACLLYQRGEKLTNASLRQRLRLPDRQVAQVSRLIAQARDRRLVRPADDAERSYIPAWAARAAGAADELRRI